MNIFKLVFGFTIIVLILLGGVFGLIRLVNSDAIPFSLGGGSSQDSNGGSNVTLPNLFSKSIDGDLLILNQSGSSSQIFQYKISTGRQKLVAKVDGWEIGNPGESVKLYKGEIYLLGKKEGKIVLAKAKNSPNSELEILFEQESDQEVLGLSVLEGQVIYTTYSWNVEVSAYDFEVIRFTEKDSKSEVLSSGEMSLIPFPLANTSEGNKEIFLELYSPNYQQRTDSCLNLQLEELSCFELSGLDEEYLSDGVSPEGFPAGKNANISLVTKKEISIILEGELNKHFGSLTKLGDDIYFISGDLESPKENEQQETLFEEFEPVFLEKFNLKKSVRTELSDLPASSRVEIAYVDKDFVVLSVVQSGNNSLWLYNNDKDLLSKVEDIKCEELIGCDNYLLSAD